MAQMNVVIVSSDDMHVKMDTQSPCESVVTVAQYLKRAALGCGSASVTMSLESSGAAASGTITLASMVATDTITVGNQVFTCMASGASGNNQFNVGLSDTLTAAAAAAVINAHPALQSVVTASPALAVITLTAAHNGPTGNMIDLAISAHGSVSAAHMAGGSSNVSNVMHLGA